MIINSFSLENNYSDKLFVTSRRAQIKTNENRLQIYDEKLSRGEDLSERDKDIYIKLLDLHLNYQEQLSYLTRRNQNENTLVYGKYSIFLLHY